MQDVRKARRALRADGTTPSATSKEEKALRAAIGKVEALRAATVVVRGGQITFGGEPLEEKALRAFAKALLAVKLPG